MLPRQWELAALSLFRFPFFSSLPYFNSSPPHIPAFNFVWIFERIRKREDWGAKSTDWSTLLFVFSMNCEWANKFFQPLSIVFTNIPQRLHTQITAQWRPPGGTERRITRLQERLGSAALPRVKCFIMACNGILKGPGKGAKRNNAV